MALGQHNGQSICLHIIKIFFNPLHNTINSIAIRKTSLKIGYFEKNSFKVEGMNFHRKYSPNGSKKLAHFQSEKESHESAKI